MTTLQNILDFDQFTSIMEGKDLGSSLPWWDDCIRQVETSIFSDNATTHDNLHEKARTYALNYIALQTEASFIDKDKVADDIADEIEKKLKDKVFDTRPPASVAAHKEHDKIKDNPENKFIRLGL